MKVLDKNITVKSDNYIEQSICSVEEKFDIHITVHDSQGILRDTEGNPLLPGRNLHRNAYCFSGRSTQPNWNSFCTSDCYRQTEEYMVREHKPFIKKCWKGVYELVVPIVRDETLIISLFAGVFRKPGIVKPETKLDLPAKFIRMYQELPELSVDQMESLSGVLQLFGQGILSYIHQRIDVAEKPGTRKEIIKAFIYHNAHRSIKLADLGKHLYLSPSRTSHVVKQYYNRSFQELLILERMQRARVLLASTDNTLEEICSLVGIANVYYFNRLFKNFFGIPPGKFRRQQQG